jgi:hypothetical protein
MMGIAMRMTSVLHRGRMMYRTIGTLGLGIFWHPVIPLESNGFYVAAAPVLM